MENQGKDHGEIETEEFPDDFQCCVCLDLFYKPVVLACGHIACFWCVFKAMDTWRGSHCPVCRQPYNHFPSICRLLHFLLLKLYPLAYKRKERQVIEEEKDEGCCSPQFDDYLSESHSSKEFGTMGSSSPHLTTISGEKLHLESCSKGEVEPSLVKDSPESTVSDKGEVEPSLVKDSPESIVSDKDYTTTIPTTSSSEVTRNVAAQEKSMFGHKIAHGSCKQVLITDLLCAVCKQLLCRPVVLNCGHVYCEACVINSRDKVCKCPDCQSVHPNGFPKVCLVLEHFLEEQFSKEYTARKEAVLKQADHHNGTPSACNLISDSTQAQQEAAAQCPSLPTNNYSSWLSGQGPQIHVGVGCDYCGMCPIIGERHRCKDCVEPMGFDLCEGCHNSSFKLPGRFNQQHTPEHSFEIVQPRFMNNLILRPRFMGHLISRLEAEHSEEDGFDVPEGQGDVSGSPHSSGDAPLDFDDHPAVPISSNDTIQDQEGTDPTI